MVHSIVDLIMSALGPSVDGSVAEQSMSLLLQTWRALPKDEGEIIEIFGKQLRTGVLVQ